MQLHDQKILCLSRKLGKWLSQGLSFFPPYPGICTYPIFFSYFNNEMNFSAPLHPETKHQYLILQTDLCLNLCPKLNKAKRKKIYRCSISFSHCRALGRYDCENYHNAKNKIVDSKERWADENIWRPCKLRCS